MQKDLKKIRPYGDHLDDGKIQVSFTLPIPVSDEGEEAARLYLEKLGLIHPMIACAEAMGNEFTFFVGYGYAEPTIDFTAIKVPKPEFPILKGDDLLKLAQEKLGRPIVVVGGTTGSDAHTVGIDAILSIKGIHGDKGLEYYPCFRVVNLRAQVSNSVLVEKAVSLKADAILVSKLVTQQDQHLQDLKELVGMLKQETGLPKHLVKIVGGPRMDHRTARQFGFDAGFGGGTIPSEVANYIVHELVKRAGHEGEGKNRPEGDPPETPRKKGRSLLGWLNSS